MLRTIRTIFLFAILLLVLFTQLVPTFAESLSTTTISQEDSVELEHIEKQALVAINYLKNSLRNPSSLELHNVWVKFLDLGFKDCYIALEYSAQNGFGGMNRNAFITSVNKDGEIDALADLYARLDDRDGYLAFMGELYNACTKEAVIIDMDRIQGFIK